MAARIALTDRFPSRRLGTVIIAVFLCLMASFVHDVPASAATPKTKQPIRPTRRWEVIYSGKKTKQTRIVPLEKFKVIGSEDLQFIGPKPGDQYQLGKFKIDGEWAVQQGELKRTKGKNAAIIVAEAENFELEGVLNASSVGGWFILLGWKDGNGYGLYNMTFKKSGSPWFLTEFNDGEAIDFGEELHQYNWKDEEPFWLSVKNKQLNLTIGDETKVIRDRLLPEYARGQLLIGTYDTRYGPKDVRIKSLRIRLPRKKR